MDAGADGFGVVDYNTNRRVERAKYPHWQCHPAREGHLNIWCPGMVNIPRIKEKGRSWNHDAMGSQVGERSHATLLTTSGTTTGRVVQLYSPITLVFDSEIFGE